MFLVGKLPNGEQLKRIIRQSSKGVFVECKSGRKYLVNSKGAYSAELRIIKEKKGH